MVNLRWLFGYWNDKLGPRKEKLGNQKGNAFSVPVEGCSRSSVQGGGGKEREETSISC